jgi:hypothetical protein
MTSTPISVASDTARPRVVPKGWIPVETAIAWKVCGTAAPSLDTEIFLGASRANTVTAAEIEGYLRAFEEWEEPDRGRPPTWVLLEIDEQLRRRLFGPNAFPIQDHEKPARTEEETRRAEAEHDERARLRAGMARTIREKMGGLEQAEGALSKVREASNDICRAIADGRLVARGRRGARSDHPHTDPDIEAMPSNDSIDAVLLARGGFICRKEDDRTLVVLWHDVEIHAESLLVIQPAPGRPPHKLHARVIAEARQHPGIKAAEMKLRTDKWSKEESCAAPHENTVRDWVNEAHGKKPRARRGGTKIRTETQP